MSAPHLTGEGEGQGSLIELAQAKWRSSGLSDKAAKRLRFRVLTAVQVQALGSNFAAAGGLKIPYFDLHGKPTAFFRVRYLEPLPGFAGQALKPQRYAQELRTLNEVYLPPLGKDWAQIAADPKTPLYITEGELKAAAGCAAGLAVIGIGGVDVWRSSKRGIVLLPLLAKFAWKGREVCIIYDSDLATKPDVVRAQRALAQELLALGAEVSIVSLPDAADGRKQGLDDFLVANGVAALESLVENATAYPESDALWGLNEEVLLIPKMGVVIERKSGDMMDADDFRRIVYANRHYMETVVKKKQVSLVKKPLAPRWMEWEHRAAMDKIVYAPGQPKEIDKTWNVWPGWGCEPKKGDVGPFLWLMDFLFKDETKSRKWFERWLAYPIQHPGTKMYAAAFIWSREQRIGKTLVAYAMKGIYGKNFVEIKSKDLKGTFNSWAKQRQFVYMDEIRGNDAKVDADWFKGLITQDEVTIEEKFLPKYTMRDCMNYYGSSNHPDALILEDRDQRYMIHEVIGPPAERERYEMVDRWLHNGGPQALFRYLLDYNLGDFNPREHAPDTPGKRSMILLGKNDTSLWAQLLKDDPVQALKALGENTAQNCDLYTVRHLFRAFDPDNRSRSSEAAMGRALAQAGYRQMIVGRGGRTYRLYVIRNQVKWEQATNKELLNEYERFWGPNATERKL